MRSFFNVIIVQAAVCAIFQSSPALAQAPYLAKGNQEVNAFGGLSYGLENWRGSFGGNYAYAFNKHVMAYGEYSYFPGITRDLDPKKIDKLKDAASLNLIRGLDRAVKFNDFHGGVHIRLPIFPEQRIVPYLSGGFGAISGRLNGKAQVQQGSRVNSVDFNISETVPAVNAGGGFRLYLTGNGRFGIRLEAKIYKPLSGEIVGTAPFGKVSLGVFYQFQ